MLFGVVSDVCVVGGVPAERELSKDLLRRSDSCCSGVVSDVCVVGGVPAERELSKDLLRRSDSYPRGNPEQP